MWSRGASVLLRYIRYGKVRLAEPQILLQDDDGLVATYLPAGTPAKVPVTDGRPLRGQADRDWGMRDHLWQAHALRLMRWGAGYSLILFWRPDTGAFDGWYVNVEEPLRRSRFGFDTDDLILDIKVEPDGTWRWKDEDELEEAVRLGRFTQPESAEIRARAERVLEERPWPTGWEDFRPDPAWPVPRVPEGWDVV